ncbi:MAG: beta-ketoacyl-[acyl-carrier-protein] synthase family protein [Thermoguttaceae bacterium]|nr:beta-ketoacyl-[acyl-carrier-protein] synthase family protein [Thermoguttaceae bacterium]MDW8078136.1 beta-ketoacyl-[acyl-carrier-protein] synthase family protein [Thermoguttaceae bacterium]
MVKIPQGFTPENWRVVITGVGLTCPLGNSLAEFRQGLLAGRSGIERYEIRYFGATLAGICRFDENKYQKAKDRRRGTRAGSIAIYCSQEAVRDARLDWRNVDKSRVGVYVGVTEHGNVETENEIYLLSQYNYDLQVWSHYHNPRTVANNPAGEVTLNMGITGPHYCLGAACAAGNVALIHGVQMLRLGEVDIALAGGVSESIHTFGIFASFRSEGALAWHEDPTKACRPFDRDRNGIVVSEGGCMFVLERLGDALRRGAFIYGEIVGYSLASDAHDYVLPLPERQAECIRAALQQAELEPSEIDIVSTHATGTLAGDALEAQALRSIWHSPGRTRFNNTKSFIGHAMGAAAALELAGNLPAFQDNICHPTINLDNLDPACELPGLVANYPEVLAEVRTILNLSFGMLGINSAVIVKKWEGK